MRIVSLVAVGRLGIALDSAGPIALVVRGRTGLSDSSGPDVPLPLVPHKAGQRTSWASAQAVPPTPNTL